MDLSKNGVILKELKEIESFDKMEYIEEDRMDSNGLDANATNVV